MKRSGVKDWRSSFIHGRESPSRLYVLPSYLAKTSMWSLSSMSFTSKRSGDFELRRIE